MDNLPSPMLSIREKDPCPTPNAGCKSIADEELSSLMKFRFRLAETTSSKSSTESLESRLDQWYSYFHSLSKIGPHYTMALERSKLETICFIWQDSFKPSKRQSHTSISSERVAVVFNIAAVYSQMAAAENQRTVDGLTKAFKAFQSAAGALRYLRETFSGGESVDVSRECVTMLETLMGAQAQECFFNRAVLAGMSPTNCSKAARQVGLYNEQIQRALSTPPLNQYFDREWFAHVQLKASQFNAEYCYHYSIHLHKNGNVGEEIARLKMGIDRLRSTKKTVKGASSSLINVTSRLEKNMNLRLEIAERENYEIYYMRVPAASSLNDLPAYALEWPSPPERLVALDNKSTGYRAS